MLTFWWIPMLLSEQQEVLGGIFIFQKVVFLLPLPINGIITDQNYASYYKISDRIYPIECTYIRIEGLMWSREILRAVNMIRKRAVLLCYT